MLNYLFIRYFCYILGNNRLYDTYKVGRINFRDGILNSAEVFDYIIQKWCMIYIMCINLTWGICPHYKLILLDYNFNLTNKYKRLHSSMIILYQFNYIRNVFIFIE